MRWVGCIFQTQLPRDKQINGTHHNGTNAMSREAKRQKAGKSHDVTYMVRRPAGAHIPVGWRRVGGACVWGRLGFFRRQLRRDKQINGTHHNGTKTKFREARRQKAGKLNNHTRWVSEITNTGGGSLPALKSGIVLPSRPPWGIYQDHKKKKHGTPRCGGVRAVWAKQSASGSSPSKTRKKGRLPMAFGRSRFGNGGNSQRNL